MPLNDEQERRRQVVLQAVNNLAARGVEVNPEVLHYYGRYIVNDLSWEELRSIMAARANAIIRYHQLPENLKNDPAD